MVHTDRMRSFSVGLAALPLGAALLAPMAPAQAALDSFLVVGYDTSQKALSVTASPGLVSMGDEELAIAGTAVKIVLAMSEGSARLVFDPVASAHVTCGPASGPQSSLTCVMQAKTVGPGSVSVDMSAAAVATTTAVDPRATGIALIFRGGSGPDYVQGGQLADRIEGGPGEDDLFGGKGDDEVLGQEDNDQVDGESGSDVVDGGPGDDYVVGDGSIDPAEGQKGDPDWIYGGPGVDQVDAVDGVKDHRVDCNNAPGLGKVEIDYDGGVVSPSTYLDVPFNCPLILVPTAPRDVEATGDRFNINTSWSRPTFDGNDPDLRYRVVFERLPTGAKSSYDLPNDLDTNVTLGPVVEGAYKVSVLAITSAGESARSNESIVSVGRAAAPPSNVVNTYLGRFDGSVSWRAAPKPGDPTAIVTYQVALRVKDKNNAKWQKWTALPEMTTETSMDLSGSLKLFRGRVYQARVRTAMVSSVPFSEWVYSQERFAGDLPPPTITSAVAVGGKTPSTTVAWRFEGLAWKLNGFDVLSPATLSKSGKTVTGNVTYNSKTDTFVAPFNISGSPAQPTCEISVDYSAPGGPGRVTTSTPFACVPKPR